MSSNNTHYEKLTEGEWNQIEERIGERTKNLLNDMDKVSRMTYRTNEEIGDTDIIYKGNASVYEETIRKYLEDDEVLEPLVRKTNNNKKRLKKTDKIIQDNLSKQIKTSYPEIVRLLNEHIRRSIGTLNQCYGLTLQNVDMQIITFMHILNEYYEIINCLEDQIELVVVGKKLIDGLSKMSGVSAIMIEDISYLVERLVERTNFSHRILCEEYPRFLSETQYDIFIMTVAPKANIIKPYPSQYRVLEYVHNEDTNLVFYNVAIGGGKTTTAALLASYVDEMRKHAPAREEYTKLLFCCSIEAVRVQLGQLVWNLGIGLAIATIKNNLGDIKITRNKNCSYRSMTNKRGEIKSRDLLTVIISDPMTTYEMLKRDQNYILFLDEPTVGADIPNHPITKMVAKIMSICPRKTILSSASNPHPSKVPLLIQMYKSRYPDGKIKVISIPQSNTGCEIREFSNSMDTLYPHDNCRTCDDLKVMIHKIKENPFLARLYTAPLLYRLVDKFNEILYEYGQDCIEIENVFENPNSWSQVKIQMFMIRMLENIADKDNDLIVSDLCRREYNPDIEDKQIDLNRLLTTDAHKYMGGCLYICDSPIDIALMMYESYSVESGFPNIGDISSQMSKHDEMIKKEMQKLTNQLDSSDRSGKRTNKLETQIESKIDEQTRAINNRLSDMIPRHLQVNSKEHIRRYAENEHVIGCISHDKVILDLNVSQEILTLLNLGVGVYCPSGLSRDYTSEVIRRADLGLLAFMISDDSIAYGVNFPLSHVIIEDEVANRRSMMSILQMMGRAGRVGKSWCAYSYLGDETWSRFFRFIHNSGDSGEDMEAENIEIAIEEL